MSTAALRRMRWWDIGPVLELEQRLFPDDAWSPGMFWSELAQARPGGTRHYTVATTGDGTVVGYAGLMAVAGEGDVQTIAVDERHQGAGLGAALLADLVREAAVRGCADVLLEVRVDNLRAQRLYERFGFRPVGIRRGYYQPADVDALVMRLDDPASEPVAPDGAVIPAGTGIAAGAVVPDGTVAPDGTTIPDDTTTGNRHG